MPTSTRGRTRRRESGLLGMTLIGLLIVGGLGLAFFATSLDIAGRRIPEVALDAYRTASREAPSIRAGCRVDWTVLAGIAKVESDHGRINGPRTIHPDGTVTPPIIGPPLDGTAGTRRIRDTDRGRLDGDVTWDHAVGPFQVIPSTWRELGRDGNGDGRKDPNNLYDAALTAVAHLCLREPGNYDDRVQLRRALVAYNQSSRYADQVMAWIDTYRTLPSSELVAPSR